MDAPAVDPPCLQTLENLRHLTQIYLRAAHQAAHRHDPRAAARFLERAAMTRGQAWALSEARTTCFETRLTEAYATHAEAQIVELETAIGAIAMELARWPELPSAPCCLPPATGAS